MGIVFKTFFHIPVQGATTKSLLKILQYQWFCITLRQIQDDMNAQHLDIRHRIGLELAHFLQADINRRHPLRQLFWECTLRCNVHCRHCGSDCKQLAGIKDMPREDFLRVLDSVAQKCNPNDVFVIITGGEPLLRDDLEIVGREIYDRGFPWGMVTNGLLLTPERFDALCHAGLHSLTISLDGLEEEHNWLRGHNLSFQRASAAIDTVLKHPQIAFDVVTCVNQRNFGHLAEIRDFLIDKGLKGWRLFTIFPVGRAAHVPELQLTNVQFRQLLDFIKQTRKEGRIHAAFGCEGYFGNYEGDVRDQFFHCQAGITVGSVMADGAIAACASIRADYHQGNIYEDDFMDVWENRYLPHRDRKWMRTGECAKCKHWRYCQGNAMHLRDKDGNLILCHLKRLT